MKVLITDGGHKNTLSIVRHLGFKKYEIYIVHHKKSAPAYSKYCKKLFISPPIKNDDLYTEFILNLLKLEKFDVVIPVGIKSYVLFSENRIAIQALTNIVVPDFEKIQLAVDKNQTYQLCEKLGIPYPKTIYPKTYGEIDEMIGDLNFPIILKSPNEWAAKFPTIYIDSPKELNIKLNEVKLLLHNAVPVIQEKIVGGGFGFYAVYNNGQCVRYFMHQRIREYPVNGGASSCARSFYDERLFEYGKKILDELKWHGPAMVEFKKNANTLEYQLMEINPKFWGSLDLSMVAGINFPEIVCHLALNQEIKCVQNYNQNISFMWLFSSDGEFYRLKEKPSDFFVVIKDLFKRTFKNDVWLTDLKPNLKQFVDYLLSFFIKG